MGKINYCAHTQQLYINKYQHVKYHIVNDKNQSVLIIIESTAMVFMDKQNTSKTDCLLT